MAKQQAAGKISITLKQALGMIGPYAGRRILDQVKSVALIVVYLVLFQTLILGIPIGGALVIAGGIAVVILGLAFFMEGLFLGLMPLGETCGVKLPRKVPLPFLLVFAFVLGALATFAEPAIGVLQQAGSTVKAWEAPLLFLVLNKYSMFLVIAVGAGVGLAVLFGMLRFIYRWSLKPFIYALVTVLTGVSVWAAFEPNLVYLTGLAWDCGGVTTGPVTVPLVLALGIGISRAAAKTSDSGGASGFGVVTLASAFPILTVFILGFLLLPSVPRPMSALDFVRMENRVKAQALFTGTDAMNGYILKNAAGDVRNAYFQGENNAARYVHEISGSAKGLVAAFGSEGAFKEWLFKAAPAWALKAVYPDETQARKARSEYLAGAGSGDAGRFVLTNFLGAFQAIGLLSVFLIIILFIIREKPARRDEIGLGLTFAVLGMTLFSIGISLGLSSLGNQVGTRLPMSFQSVMMTEQKSVISNFSAETVVPAIDSKGRRADFFYMLSGNTYARIPYNPSNFNKDAGEYTYIPSRGPLFYGVLGILIVVFFAFMMGYGATLAEPALNALGQTVEELTVGTFRKSLLMQAVAIGVGVGIAVGVLKIIFGIPLIWLLAPPYLVLLIITAFSSEDFVNIGWDSAGVTTGPVTVPLVLAMGLGLGGQVGVVEGFGILAMASVYPILSVLMVGLVVNFQRRSAIKAAQAAE